MKVEQGLELSMIISDSTLNYGCGICDENGKCGTVNVHDISIMNLHIGACVEDGSPASSTQ